MKNYQNEHISISVESHIHLIHQVWKGIPNSENYYQAHLISLKLAQQYQIKKWLIDQSNLLMFNPIDLQWCIGQWLPEATKRLGKKVKMAIVQQDLNQFCKLGSDIVLRAGFAINPSLESRYFLKEDEAREWLLSKKICYSASVCSIL